MTNLPIIRRRQYVDSLPVDAVEIPGFANNYATPAGEIYSKFGRLKLRRLRFNRVGYPICGLRATDGSHKWPLIHRIIARLFVPGDQSLDVNHKDMVKTNCSATNLEWVTKSANQRHGFANKPDWGSNIGAAVSRALVATNPTTGERHEFRNGRLAAAWVGNPTASGNISKACVHGREAYGFVWAKV